MSPAVVYPLRFEPIYQYRLWGGRGVCVEGSGVVEHGPATYAVRGGDVLVLPACLGACAVRPNDTVTLLEIALPDASACKADQERS